MADCRSAAEELGDSLAGAAEAPDVFPAVAAVAQAGSRVAEAAVQGALPEADCCAAADFQAAQLEVDCPVATGAEYPADGLAARALSAEFQADDYFPGAVVVDCFQAVPVVVLVDDCSRDGCPGIAGVAAPASGQNDYQTADAAPAPDDRCPQERCGFLEEPDGYPERRAEEHYRWGDRQEHCCWDRCY